MASVQDIVDGIPLKDLQPVKPETEVLVEPDLEVEKVEAIVERLVKPWKWGDNLCRFGRKVGVPLKRVRQIKEALDARLRAEAKVEPKAKEPKELEKEPEQ